jgi:hypothetical protein
VYKKYSNKKFLRASQFAREWANTNLATAFNEYVYWRSYSTEQG